MHDQIKKICIRPFYQFVKALITTFVLLIVVYIVILCGLVDKSNLLLEDTMNAILFSFVAFIFVLSREVITSRTCILVSNKIEAIHNGFLDSSQEIIKDVEEKENFFFGKTYKFIFQYRTITINERMYSSEDFKIISFMVQLHVFNKS